MPRKHRPGRNSTPGSHRAYKTEGVALFYQVWLPVSQLRKKVFRKTTFSTTGGAPSKMCNWVRFPQGRFFLETTLLVVSKGRPPLLYLLSKLLLPQNILWGIFMKSLRAFLEEVWEDGFGISAMKSFIVTFVVLPTIFVLLSRRSYRFLKANMLLLKKRYLLLKKKWVNKYNGRYGTF